MSEGELKKRISHQFAEREYPYVDTMEGEFGGCVDYEDEIIPILDEAKREFPQKREHTTEDIDLRVMLAKTYFETLDKWFKKWFGDAEK